MGRLVFTGAILVGEVTHPTSAPVFEFRFVYESGDPDVPEIEFKIQRVVKDSLDIAESLVRAKIGRIAQDIARLAAESRQTPS